MSAPRHCDVAAGPVDLYGRTVGAPDLPSMADVSATPDVQSVAGRRHLYVGGACVADDGCGPLGELPSERVQAVVQIETDDVVDVRKDEAQTDAGRRSGGFLVRAPGAGARRRGRHAGDGQRALIRGASNPPVAGRQLVRSRVLLHRAVRSHPTTGRAEARTV